jgi:hypothetical protein
LYAQSEPKPDKSLLWKMTTSMEIDQETDISWEEKGKGKLNEQPKELPKFTPIQESLPW